MVHLTMNMRHSMHVGCMYMYQHNTNCCSSTDALPEECTRGSNQTADVMSSPVKRRRKSKPVSSGPFTCTICSKSFKHGKYLRNHVKLNHENRKTFVCEVCNKAFGHKSRLAQHMQLHEKVQDGNESVTSQIRRVLKEKRAGHPEYNVAPNSDGLYPCVLCPGKTFKNKSSMNDHLDCVHFEFRSLAAMHPCPVCGKHFMKPSEVKAHMTKHTGLSDSFSTWSCVIIVLLVLHEQDRHRCHKHDVKNVS